MNLLSYILCYFMLAYRVKAIIIILHVQGVEKYCFSLSNMQICGAFVAVVVVVA